MTSRLSTAILLGCTALLLATSAHAQVIRPSETLYLALKGGVTTYGGEIDQTGAFDDPSDDAGNRAWVTRDFGPGFGLEIGYQFTESLSFGGQFRISLPRVGPASARRPAPSSRAWARADASCLRSSAVSAPLSAMGPRFLKAANESWQSAHSSVMTASFSSSCSSARAMRWFRDSHEIKCVR